MFEFVHGDHKRTLFVIRTGRSRMYQSHAYEARPRGGWCGWDIKLAGTLRRPRRRCQHRRGLAGREELGELEGEPRRGLVVVDVMEVD
jgi:hypothetical protein